MRYNKLGDSGLLVSELSYGAWITLGSQGQVSQSDQCLAIMKAAYDGGDTCHSAYSIAVRMYATYIYQYAYWAAYEQSIIQ